MVDIRRKREEARRNQTTALDNSGYERSYEECNNFIRHQDHTIKRSDDTNITELLENVNPRAEDDTTTTVSVNQDTHCSHIISAETSIHTGSVSTSELNIKKEPAEHWIRRKRESYAASMTIHGLPRGIKLFRKLTIFYLYL